MLTSIPSGDELAIVLAFIASAVAAMIAAAQERGWRGRRWFFISVACAFFLCGLFWPTIKSVSPALNESAIALAHKFLVHWIGGIFVVLTIVVWLAFALKTQTKEVASMAPKQNAQSEQHFTIPARLPVSGYIGVGGSADFRGGEISGPEAGVYNYRGKITTDGTNITATNTGNGVAPYVPNHKYSTLSSKELNKQLHLYAENILELKQYFDGEHGLPPFYENFKKRFAAEGKELYWEAGNRILGTNVRLPENNLAQFTIIGGTAVGKFSIDETSKFFIDLANSIPE